jgi:hypothetical protein
VLVKPDNDVVRLADVEAAGIEAFENVDEIQGCFCHCDPEPQRVKMELSGFGSSS